MNSNTNLLRRSILSLIGTAPMAALAYPFASKLLSQSPMKKLQTRTIPSSGEAIPIVGLGTWQTFDAGNNQSQRENLTQVLRTLFDAGGRVVDSSPMYGSSERVVGDLAKELGIAEELFMATKVWTNGKQSGIDQMQSSFQKMQTQQMDLMQVHNLLDFETHIQTLVDWKAQGKIRHIGVTHYTDSSHDRLTEIIKKHPIDFLQINYSIQSRNAAKRLLPTALDEGVAVLINRPYESGSLFRQTKGKELPEWAKDYDIESWGQFFLKYILSNPAVSCVIPGTSKVHHLQDNLKAGMGAMPDEKIRRQMVTFLN